MDGDRRIHRLTLQYTQPRQYSEITLLRHERPRLHRFEQVHRWRATLRSKKLFLTSFLSVGGFLSTNSMCFVKWTPPHMCFFLLPLNEPNSHLRSADQRPVAPPLRLSGGFLGHKDVSRTSPGRRSHYTLLLLHEGEQQHAQDAPFHRLVLWKYANN